MYFLLKRVMFHGSLSLLEGIHQVSFWDAKRLYLYMYTACWGCHCLACHSTHLQLVNNRNRLSLTGDLRAHERSHVGPQLLVHLQDPKVYSITFSGSIPPWIMDLITRLLGQQSEFCPKKGSPNVAPLNSSKVVRYKPRISRWQGNSTREIAHFPSPQCEMTTRKFLFFVCSSWEQDHGYVLISRG